MKEKQIKLYEEEKRYEKETWDYNGIVVHVSICPNGVWWRKVNNGSGRKGYFNCCGHFGTKTLDPRATNDNASSRVMVQIYDTLVEQDENTQIQPGLAESWEQVDDVTTVFHLRKGVKFHNGEELKASDVKFSIDAMKAAPQTSEIIEPLKKLWYWMIIQ